MYDGYWLCTISIVAPSCGSFTKYVNQTLPFTILIFLVTFQTDIFLSTFKERGDLKRKEDDAKSEMRELRDSVEDMKIKIETYVAEKRNITAEFRIQARTTIRFWTEQLILKTTSGWLLSIVLVLWQSCFYIQLL